MVPLTLLRTPFMNPPILFCINSISSATSSISPVCLSMNSPISFCSIPLAHFKNSAVAPFIFTSAGVPHLPLPTCTVYFFLLSAAFWASVCLDALPRSLTVDTVLSSPPPSFSLTFTLLLFWSLFVVSPVPPGVLPPSPCSFGS